MDDIALKTQVFRQVITGGEKKAHAGIPDRMLPIEKGNTETARKIETSSVPAQIFRQADPGDADEFPTLPADDEPASDQIKLQTFRRRISGLDVDGGGKTMPCPALTGIA